jgi:hypothetical protein
MQSHGVVKFRQRREVYIPCMSPRNYADCVGNDCDAVLSHEIITGRSLLAQFGFLCWRSRE